MSDSDSTGGLPEVTENQARAWLKAEDVAIHFNEMILNFRLKALSAVTVAAGLVGAVLLNKDGQAAPQVNYLSFSFAIWFLAVVWFAIMCLDLGYYHRLLLGAVDEALRIESSSGGRLQLSTMIRKRAEEGPGDSIARGAFYALPLAAMIVAGCVAWRYAPPGPRFSSAAATPQDRYSQAAPCGLRPGSRQGASLTSGFAPFMRLTFCETAQIRSSRASSRGAPARPASVYASRFRAC